ncbi:MAG: endonuclease III [Nanoarchaeota archaeon]
MKSEKEISKVIELVKKAVEKFENPIVTEVADLTRDPFKVLISCILSLRTKDQVTAKASKRLFELADNPYDMVKLDKRRIEKAIYPVGFYKTKAKRIKEICKKLIEEYNGKVPDTIEELLRFKGVGRKTAAITIVYGHKRADYIPVDVHVHIITNRLGWVKTKNPDDTMHELMRIVPKKYWYDLNDTFVKFGQNICVTISPFCSKCPIYEYCDRIGVTRSR